MFYMTETKFQGWRALALFADRTECLVYVGRSTAQVRAHYAAAYREVTAPEKRAEVREISLQCWEGTADKGRWVPKGTLALPSDTAGAHTAGSETATSPGLPEPPDAEHAAPSPFGDILSFESARRPARSSGGVRLATTPKPPLRASESQAIHAEANGAAEPCSKMIRMFKPR